MEAKRRKHFFVLQKFRQELEADADQGKLAAEH